MTAHFPRWRLRLLSIFATLVVCVLFYRIVQIQIVRHRVYYKRAMSQWHEKVARPARRGSIFDRNGVPLAVTHRTYTLGVTPGQFVKDAEAVEYISGLVGRSKRKLRASLTKNRVYVPLGRDFHLTQEQVEKISSFRSVRLDQNQDRLYPFDAMPSQLLGRVDCDGRGAGGIELAFQGILGGRDGWLLANRNARDSTYHPVNAPGKKPLNGNDIYLTIDSRIQSVVDFELEQAVERCGAAGGAVIVIDPASGDILALSERISGQRSLDLRRPQEIALYSASCIYEPGSTFKLITDSYLLEKGRVDPYDVFYGEKGEAEFDFGVFRDDHPSEWLTFKETFVYSSNICTIKAVKDSDPHDFYSYILSFGFGGRTGVNLPAESKGTLRKPSEWSARSLPSISIGHEIGVTPLQMVMAYCALANDGGLPVPRIALEARDEKGRTVKEFPPVIVRRVFSKKTAGTLKDFCREVVAKGTGVKAAVKGIAVAGKTGTSQKAGQGGYQPGKYVASFVGFAPFDEPKIVCLVVLDEPAYPYYWGGESSAIVFSKIVEGINLTTDLLFEGTDWEVAVGCGGGKRIEVPSFLRLKPRDAMKLAASCGLQIHCSPDSGIVYSQIPDPGTLTEGGKEVRLLFRPNTVSGSGKVRVPDLMGLSIREARRLLIACGLRSRLRGYGNVEKQSPSPGRLI
ncbi:MAG: PASTA domain-containing protein, partial [Candidatus Krumholzibacteria bacterium]|nr:PASTA domain-containing protein [Candidatus Krumholzibacteria bacterium]